MKFITISLCLLITGTISSEDISWQEDIRLKLVTTFSDDPESLTRVLWYLDEEDRSYKESEKSPPAWSTLKSTLTSDVAFKKYAAFLAEDTKTAEKDVAFRKTMNLVYSQMMVAKDETVPEETFQDYDVSRIKDVQVGQLSGFMGLAHAWKQIPLDSQIQIVSLIPKIVGNHDLILAIDDVIGLGSKGGGLVNIALAKIWLSIEAYNNLRRWWNGEISGKRCAKNIIDSAATIGAGVGGGMGGAYVGSVFGPIGTVIGGFLGGMFSAQVTNYYVDRLTQTMFSLPKEVALENAYNFIGVSMTASNTEINGAYRGLARRYHPDKGGNSDDFQLLQYYMGVIKLARGEDNF